MNIVKFFIGVTLLMLSILLPSSVLAQTGIASYYGDYHHGRLTASGVRFNMHAMTAAHRTLPFGTKLKVTAIKSGKSIYVVVNDRGPYVGNRIIDLSQGAATALGIKNSGIAKVHLEIVGKANLGPTAYQNKKKAKKKVNKKKYVPKHKVQKPIKQKHIPNKKKYVSKRKH